MNGRIFCVLGFLIIVAHCLCAATPLQDKVANFLPKDVYQKNSNFIKKIFANEKRFYKDGRLDIQAILSALKSNGLLMLKLSKPSNISVTFRINEYAQLDNNPSFTYLSYTISNMLANMGYSYFYVTNVKKRDNKISITYTLNSESNIDPSVLTPSLIGRGYGIADVNRYSNTHWIYDISLLNANIPSSNVVNPGASSFARISGRYWLSFSGVGTLKIKPKDADSFYPKVLVFNQDMNIIDSVMETSGKPSYEMKIDSNIKYIMITDNYNPTNLRNGIDINFNAKQ